jgi:hypothetical protein
MSQQFAKIIGPINQGENFYMGKVIQTDNGNVNVILKYNTIFTSVFNYAFNFPNDPTNTNIAILRAEYYFKSTSKDFNPNYIKLYDTINKVYINGVGGLVGSFSSDPTIPNPEPIFSSNQDNIIWAYPTLFLANIPYNFLPCSNQSIDKCAPFYSNIVKNVYIIPQKIYYNNSGTCSIPKDPSYTIWMNTPPPSGASQSFYWSNLNDCNVDVPYEYCTITQTCGDENCKGICPSKQMMIKLVIMINLKNNLIVIHMCHQGHQFHQMNHRILYHLVS